MHIHCTKKLFEKLPPSLTSLEPAPQAIGVYEKWVNWHANVVVMQRRQNLIFVNDATRFAVFIPIVVQKDLKALPSLFTEALLNTLLKSGVDAELIDKATALMHHQSFCYDTVCNRSVQGTMRLMASDIDYGLIFNGEKITDLLPYSTSVWLNNRPCSVKNRKEYVWPNQEMAKLIRQVFASR